MKIVKVQFKNKLNDEFGGTAYSYYDESGELEVGEKVNVPSKFGSGEAVVCEVDVAEEEVVTFKDFMKVIPIKKDEPLEILTDEDVPF